MEAVEPGIMKQKPKPKDEGIFANGFGVRTVLQGAMFGILALAAFFIGHKMTGNDAGGRTLAFMVLALSQVVQAYNMRSARSLFRIGPFGNKILNLAALASIILVSVLVFTPARAIFGMVALTTELYLIGVGLILVPLVVMEVGKFIGWLIHRK